MAGDRYLTYRQAAARVHRSKRAIQRWRKHGMPMGYNAAGERIVQESVLLAEFRRRLRNDPVHQQRLRVLRNERKDQT